MKINPVVIAITIALSGIGAAHALELGSGEETDADINGEIILRCQYQLGEFGIAAVNTCIESEHNARKALSSYPEETADIVWRCIGSRYDVGWEMIKICADNDIAADVALRAYAPEHADIIKACRDKIGQYRHAEVKKCVDDLLAEQRSVPK